MTKYSITLAIVGLLACVLSIGGTRSPALATHTFGSSPPLFKDLLWSNLEVGGNQRITYSICSASLPPVVTTGIEQKWDDIFPRWSFDLIGGCNEATKVDWEGTQGYCETLSSDPDAIRFIGCFNWTYYLAPHGNHHHFASSLILFDVNHPDGHTYASFGPNAQTAISAHEWGHNMGLEDHSGTPCGVGLLMGETFDVDRKASDNPCFTGPTIGERASVECNVYRLCAGVRVAVGNVVGNSCPEVITAPGSGPDSWVRVWGAASGCIGSGAPMIVLAQFRAYVSGFQGGVYLAAGNVDTSTALDEVITGAGPGGGPHVKLWRVNFGTSTSTEISGYMAYEGGFSGGVRVGAGNLSCTGGMEILTAPGNGRLTEVRTWTFTPPATWTQVGVGFQPYPGWVGGAFVAGGNLSDAYCFDELGTGADAGGGPHAKTFCCASGSATLGSWMAYGGFGGGVRVGTGNHDLDNELEFITGPGPGSNPQVRIWNKDGTEVFCCGFYAYDFGWTGGVFVAGGNVDLAGRWEIVTGADAGGGPHVKIWRCCPPSQPVSEVIGWMAW